MTPQQVITEVRKHVQDADAPYRNSDTALLGFVNQTLKRMCTVRPDLFTYYGDIPTQAGKAMQSLPDDSARLVEIFSVKGGNVVNETVREVLDLSYPGWQSAAAGTPVNYVRHIRNPSRYFLTPPPAAGTILLGEYTQTPINYTLTQPIELLSDVYFPIVIDGTVWLTEGIDNEYANGGRGQKAKEQFYEALGISLQSRIITDSESGGLKSG